jgi:arabinofuranosyltransferase
MSPDLTRRSKISWGNIALSAALLLMAFFLLYRTWVIRSDSIPLINVLHDVGAWCIGTGTLALALIVVGYLLENRTITSLVSPSWVIGCTLLSVLGYQLTRRLEKPYLGFEHMAFILVFTVVSIAWAVRLSKGREDDSFSVEHRKDNRKVALIIFVVCLALLIVWAIPVVRLERFEDIFITFRYGYHLAAGQGINWNAADPVPTEGYTTFSWVLLSALFIGLRIDPLAAMQVVSGVSLLALTLLVWASARDLWAMSPSWALVPAGLLIVLPAMSYHIATGMETLFFSATLAGISWLALKWVREPSNGRWAVLFGVIMLVSGLTRPDGILYGGVLLAVIASIGRRQVATWANGWRLFLFLILPGIVYFIWRLTYFGQVLPNSFYHKQSDVSVWLAATGDVMYTDFLALLALPFLALALHGLLRRRWKAESLLYVLPALVCVLYYTQVLPVAGNQYRFFIPFLFAFIVAASGDLVTLLSRVVQQLGTVLTLGLALATISLFYVAPFIYTVLPRVNALTQNQIYDETRDYYMRTGRVLQLLPSNTVIGIGEVGKIGMLLKDYTVIDIIGLNDTDLAHHPFSGAYLDSRGVNVLVTIAYPGQQRGIYEMVYRSVGEHFSDIEDRFVCIGGIDDHFYFDVFVRRTGDRSPDDYAAILGQNRDFKLGACQSTTSALWTPAPKMPIDLEMIRSQWSTSGLTIQPSLDRGLELQPLNSDPQLRSPNLDFSAADYSGVTVNFIAQPSLQCRIFSVYFTRPDDTIETESKGLTLSFVPSGKPQGLFFNFSNNSEWRGSIHTLRFRPSCRTNDSNPLLNDRITLLGVGLR